jgi:hypothetical protein
VVPDLTRQLAAPGLPWTSRDATVLAPRRRPDVRATAVEDEFLLTDTVDGSTLFLNETATIVWQGCDGVTSLRDVARRLAERYDVTIDDALVDVEEIVELFAGAGLLVLAEPES